MPSVIYTDPKMMEETIPPPPKRVLSKEQQVAVDIRNVLSRRLHNTSLLLYVVMLMLNVECAPIFLKLAAVVDME